MALRKGYLDINLATDGRGFKLASNSQPCIDAAVEVLRADANLTVHELEENKVWLPDEPPESAQDRFNCTVEIKALVNSQTYLAELQDKLQKALAERNLLCTINAVIEQRI